MEMDLDLPPGDIGNASAIQNASELSVSMYGPKTLQEMFKFPSMDSGDEWKSDDSFNAMGMQSLFWISNQTLAWIFPERDQYLTYAANYESFLDVSNVDWQSLVMENKEPVGVLVVYVVVGVLLTLIGMCWCLSKICCDRKGCCSSRKDHEELRSARYEEKGDKWTRLFCGMMFSSFIVLFLFGLVCCFVTNEQIKIAIEDAPEDIDKGLQDAETYLKKTNIQIKTLLEDNYDILADKLNQVLDDSGEIIKDGLSEKTGADALSNLTDILNAVHRVRENVLKVNEATNSLKTNADQLQYTLNSAKENLLEALRDCSSTIEQCRELARRPEIEELRVKNDFQKLPDMTDILAELSKLLGDDVRSSIEDGKRAFDRLGMKIKTEVEPAIPEIKKVIKKSREELREVAESLSKAINDIPVSQGRDHLPELEQHIEQYAPYRYQATLGVCALLTFIFCLMTLGIFIGCCGRQPGSDRSNECCSRKTGSSFINCGIFFMFLTSGVLLVVALGHFLAAGSLTRIICESIDKADNRTEAVLSIPKYYSEKYKYESPPYYEIIRACKVGESAYNAFHLESVYDVEKLFSKMGDPFKRKVRKLADQVYLPEDATLDIVFLTPETKAQMREFVNAQINRVNFDAFAASLEKSIVAVSLDEMMEQLNMLIKEAQKHENVPGEVIRKLRHVHMLVTSSKKLYLTPMLENVSSSAKILKELSQKQGDLVAKVEQVSKLAEQAQESLREAGAGQKQIRDLAYEFEAKFVGHVEEYANYTLMKFRDSVGKCDPLYHAFNSTKSTFCVKLGLPVAGFWFTLSCIVFVFIPLIFIGIVLAGLYTKYKSLGYESDTYYSTYGDGDTIPLNSNANSSGGGGGRRMHKRTRDPGVPRYSHRYEDTAQNFGLLNSSVEGNEDDDVSQYELPIEDSNSEELQNIFMEMDNLEAWGSQLVFSNHHTPPASGEYERPPPYYYPGPANNN